MRRFLLTLPLSVLLVTSCSEPVTTPGVAVAQVHDVACGCAIDAIGHCGNYIKVGDEFVELTGDLKLGDMAFCQQKDLKAEVVGEVKEGKFVATSFQYVAKK